MPVDFDLEALVHLEQTFYEEGYKDGFEHGKIHGLIEGRALGRAKGFEMWEELGFYEGFARMWQTIFDNQPAENDRAINHIRRLLELISQFPKQNPSYSDPELDVPKLFRQIRSRYKILCSTLGVRPTLRYSERSQDRDEMTNAMVTDGPPKIDQDSTGKSRSKPSVWRIDNIGPQASSVNQRGLDF